MSEKTEKHYLSEIMGLEAGMAGMHRMLLDQMNGGTPMTREGIEQAIVRHDEYFQTAKKRYEDHCAKIGEPAYMTYNED
jgi:hypothetical protein